MIFCRTHLFNDVGIYCYVDTVEDLDFPKISLNVLHSYARLKGVSADFGRYEVFVI